MNRQQQLDQVLAVIVLYRCECRQSAAYTSLENNLLQINAQLELLLYDNSPTSLPVPDSAQLHSHYLHDPGNGGVSKAYNRAFDLAQKKGKKWLLLLDQDTTLPADALDAYLSAIQSHPREVVFVPVMQSSHYLISPFKSFFKKGLVLKDIQPGRQLLSQYRFINSGTWISLDAFARAGGYNETIRLDFSDFYFTDQLKKHYPSFVVIRLRCPHALSAQQQQDFGSSLRRFGFYCQGAAAYTDQPGEKTGLFLLSLLRACKLAWQYKSIAFFTTFFHHWFKS